LNERFTDLKVLAYEADHENNETISLIELPDGALVLAFTFEAEDPESQLWPKAENGMAWDSYSRYAAALRGEGCG
jgi:hypothetical protein